MKKDYYTDSILGKWTHDKKASNKENLCYRRQATVTLHKDYAVDWTDPADYKEYNLHGDVILTETKLFNIATSDQNYFRGVELTDKTEKTLKLK